MLSHLIDDNTTEEWYQEGDDPAYTVSGDLRGHFPDIPKWESNHEICDSIVERVKATNPELYGRLDFDPEYSCFFAHAKTLADASALVTVIEFLAREASSALPMLHYASGSMSWRGFDLSRITITKLEDMDDTPWLVWIPPTGPQSFEGGIPSGDLISPFGESFWPTREAACSFVGLCLQDMP